MPAITTPMRYLRRVIEPDGTVHAARYAGDTKHFTTACAVHPAPQHAELRATPDREITCLECRKAACPCVSEYGHGLTPRTVHQGGCPA